MRFLIFFSLLLSTIANAQITFSTSSIDPSLKENAQAVVRLDETKVELSASNKMQVHRRRVITILKKAGESSIKPYAFYDPGTKLSDIEAFVYNEQGNEIEKMKRNDFQDISAVDGGTLYGDSRVKIFRYTPVSYPYTIDFSYTYTTSNTAFLPRWMPVDDYMVSTERSVFVMNINEGMNFRKKEKNFENYPITNKSKGSTLNYEMLNVPAEKREMLSPAFYNFEPQLLVALDNFHLEGVDGRATDWNTMGKWQHSKLLAGRDVLPQSTVNTISQELDGVTDKIEKVKKIYKYVQDNTRYISVQLGIGGWQPISAEEVDRVKYGDCKGLTNYTKALLKSQGIESYYSVVYAGDSKRGMEQDFAIMQGNHVILNVPNEGDDIWLECTSQQIPFGFLSDFTDDRDVLVVTPKGGEIKHTESYLNDENKQLTKAVMKISPEGDLEGEVIIQTSAIQYDQHSRLESMTEKQKDEYYKEYWDNINGIKIQKSTLQNDKANVEFIENIKISAASYAITMDQELLFKPNAFNPKNFVPERYRNRKLPFEISRGYTDEDEFVIQIPEGFKVSELPEVTAINSDFGTYHMTIEKLSENELRYSRKIQISSGLYDKEKYSDYRDFSRAIKKADNIKLILRK